MASDNKKTDFIICYEHINREVENITILKHELQRRGYSCELMHYNGSSIYTASKNKAKVVLAPWMRYNENVFHYLLFARSPYKLVNLQWEQVYSIQGIKSGLVNVSGEALKAIHFCWGENSRNRLIKSGVSPNRAIIVGAIQQDYGRKRFDDYFLSKEDIADEFKLDINKPWILFVSSFALANYNKKSLDILKDKYGNYIYENHMLHKNSQEKLLTWTEELLEKIDCEFIYRPHPSELVSDRLKDLQRKYTHFKVIDKYSVKQWAKVSNFVNLWISTSNAEIASLGITYNIIRPLPIPKNLEVESMYECSFVTTLNEYITSNSFGKSTNSNDENQLSELKRFYDYEYERPAYLRIVDKLEEIYSSDEYICSFNFSIIDKLKYNYFEQKKRIISFIMEKVKTSPKGMKFPICLLNSNIKKNIKKQIDLENNAKTIEDHMLKYLEEHE